jgi:hypothetical protein
MERLTAQEARDLAERIIPPVSVVNRSAPMTGDDLLNGIADTIGRALMTDTDGVFALIRHLVNRTRFQAQQVADDVVSLRRLGPAARAEAPIVVSKVPELVDLLDQMMVAPAGQLARLKTKFDTLVAQYARSSRTASGQQTVGLSPYSALSEGLVLVARIERMVPVLLANTLRIQTALADYVATDLAQPSHLRGLQHARDILQSHAGRVDTDQSPAIVDAALVSGMLGTTATAPDPREFKYEGGGTVEAFQIANWVTKRALTITGPLSDWSPLRAGDRIWYDTVGAPVAWGWLGTVAWVDGLTVWYTMSPGAWAGGAFATDGIRIQSRGSYSYDLLSNQMSGLVSNGQVRERLLPDATRGVRTYLESGAATNGMSLMEDIRTWANLLVSTLGAYEASGVDTIEVLLSHLRDERLPQLADALQECRFHSLRDVGPLLSAPAQMDDLLQGAIDSIGRDDEDVLVRYGRAGTDDYFHDGEG